MYEQKLDNKCQKVYYIYLYAIFYLVGTAEFDVIVAEKPRHLRLRRRIAPFRSQYLGLHICRSPRCSRLALVDKYLYHMVLEGLVEGFVQL